MGFSYLFCRIFKIIYKPLFLRFEEFRQSVLSGPWKAFRNIWQTARQDLRVENPRKQVENLLLFVPRRKLHMCYFFSLPVIPYKFHCWIGLKQDLEKQTILHRWTRTRSRILITINPDLVSKYVVSIKTNITFLLKREFLWLPEEWSRMIFHIKMFVLLRKTGCQLLLLVSHTFNGRSEG